MKNISYALAQTRFTISFQNRRIEIGRYTKQNKRLPDQRFKIQDSRFKIQKRFI